MGVGHEGQFITELVNLFQILALANRVCHFLQLYEAQGLLISVVLDNRAFCCHDESFICGCKGNQKILDLQIFAFNYFYKYCLSIHYNYLLADIQIDILCMLI